MKNDLTMSDSYFCIYTVYKNNGFEPSFCKHMQQVFNFFFEIAV